MAARAEVGRLLRGLGRERLQLFPARGEPPRQGGEGFLTCFLSQGLRLVSAGMCACPADTSSGGPGRGPRRATAARTARWRSALGPARRGPPLVHLARIASRRRRFAVDGLDGRDQLASRGSSQSSLHPSFFRGLADRSVPAAGRSAPSSRRSCPYDGQELRLKGRPAVLLADRHERLAGIDGGILDHDIAQEAADQPGVIERGEARADRPSRVPPGSPSVGILGPLREDRGGEVDALRP